MAGMLYIVATPIGNLRDISLRALDVLKSVDFIAAEDTRVTLKLLNHYNVKKPLLSYHEHNKFEKGEIIVSRLQNGENCALVSDAGTPIISDPGVDLLRTCRKNNIEITTIPGACAAVSAISLSVFDNSCFCFEGFLSSKKSDRNCQLKRIAESYHNVILYEAPHKLLKTLKDLNEYCGNRKINLIRELTKVHEEVLDLDLISAINLYSETNIARGEFVVILQGTKFSEKAINTDPLLFDKAIKLASDLVYSGKSRSEASKIAAKEYGLKKSEIYKKCLDLVF